MPLCPQITNTPITVTQTADFTVSSVLPGDVPPTTGEMNTAIQTSANGKNKITYSTSAPGSTANTVGDLWWQYSGSIIIGQWTGAGGTSWTSNTVGNAVIANLDAGKITTGILDAITITGCTITGGTIQTSTGAAAVILNGASNAVQFKNASSIVGNIVPYSSSGIVMHYGATPTPGGTAYPNVSVFSSTVAINGGSLTGFSSGSSSNNINGPTFALGTLTCSATAALSVTGAMTYSGIATASGSTVVVVTTGSRIGYVSSTRATKKNIQSMVSGSFIDKLATLEPVEFDWKDQPDDMPYRRNYGLIADDVALLNNELESLVNYNAEGNPVSISYDRLTPFLVMAIRELKTQLDQLGG